MTILLPRNGVQRVKNNWGAAAAALRVEFSFHEIRSQRAAELSLTLIKLQTRNAADDSAD